MGAAARVCSIRSGRPGAMAASVSTTRRLIGLSARSAWERYREFQCGWSEFPAASVSLRDGGPHGGFAFLRGKRSSYVRPLCLVAGGSSRYGPFSGHGFSNRPPGRWSLCAVPAALTVSPCRVWRSWGWSPRASASLCFHAQSQRRIPLKRLLRPRPSTLGPSTDNRSDCHRRRRRQAGRVLPLRHPLSAARV